MGIGIFKTGEANKVCIFLRDFPALLFPHAGDFKTKFHIAQNSAPRHKIQRLEHHSYALIASCYLFSVKIYAAGYGRIQTGNDIH